MTAFFFGQNNYRMNWVTLSFSGSLEAAFSDNYFEKSLIQVRIALLSAIVLYGVFGILDAWILPEVKYTLWIIRYALYSPFAFAIFLFSFSRHFKKYMQHSIALVVLMGGIGIIVMILIAPQPESYLYYAGLMIVVIYNYTFCRLRFIWATLAGWTVVIMYEIVAIWLTHTPFLVLLNNNFFFLSGNILGMFAAYSTEYSLRKEFIQTSLLNVERQKVFAANRSLEKSVDERTQQLVQANQELEQEIVERRHVEAKLQQAKEFAEAANQSKSQFLANMSHELRTPLNHIIGFTELIVDKHFGVLNETQEDYLHDVLYSSKFLLTLINDILDLAKVEAGKLELDVETLNIRTLLEHSLTIIQEKAIKHRIQVSSDIHDDIPEFITADERKLKQIMYNLLSNAIKFTPENGSITLVAALRRCDKHHALTHDGHFMDRSAINNPEHLQTGDSLVIAVKDTGIGLTQKNLTRIFAPFEQADSLNRTSQGTGLGLSLVKHFVELHGGRIWAESEGEEKGSTFTFRIPI